MIIHPYKLHHICAGLFVLADICGEFM
jgi:hypothetical protein